MQHIEHASAHEPCNFRRVGGTQAKRRKGHLLQRSPAAGGENRPDEHEQNDEQPGDDEIRHRNADRGDRHQRKIEHSAAPHGGNHTGGESQRQREAQSHYAECRRNRQSCRNHVVHRKIGHPEAQAEIQVRVIIEFNQVLLPERQIEVVPLGVRLLDSVRRFAFAAERTAGDRVHQEKRDGEHRPQGADHPQQPSPQKPNHPRPPAFRNLFFSSSSIQMVFSGCVSSKLGYQPFTYGRTMFVEMR